MDKYTEKYFFEEIRSLLENREVEKIKPILLFVDREGMLTLLHWSGNKVIGEVIEVVKKIYKEA